MPITAGIWPVSCQKFCSSRGLTLTYNATASDQSPWLCISTHYSSSSKPKGVSQDCADTKDRAKLACPRKKTAGVCSLERFCISGYSGAASHLGFCPGQHRGAKAQECSFSCPWGEKQLQREVRNCSISSPSHKGMEVRPGGGLLPLCVLSTTCAEQHLQ